MNTAALRQPSAYIPLAMSGGAMLVLLVAFLNHGLGRQPDENAYAHLWQILMGGQLPIIAFFALKWLPRAPAQALLVLALQLGAGLAACAPVWYLRL